MKKFYLLLLTLIPILPGAQTVFVDDSNNTGIEDGSSEFPFKSLYDGIGSAQVGDTVFIRNGLYDPAPYTYFRLKDGIIVMGEDSAKTVVTANFENNLASMNHYTEISNLTCNGVYFSNGDGSATVVIKNCSIGSAAFSSGSGYTYSIENCIIENGVFNSSGDNYWFVKNCVIKNGQIRDSGTAPEGVEAHIIENNDITYVYDGEWNSTNAVFVISSQSITIKNNRIKAKNKCSGIVSSSSSPTNFIDNIIICDKPTDLLNDNFCGIITSSGEGVVTGNTIIGGKMGYNSSSAASIFSNNTISQSHYGFKSSGGEEVYRNKITNCSGHGVISYGFKGPFYKNIVMDNDSAGVLGIPDMDLGGGLQNGPGENILKNNGWYDFVFPAGLNQYAELFAKHNTWDHSTLADILQYDILNQSGTNLTINIDSFNTNIHPQVGSKIYVDKNNDSGFEIGTEEYPFTKIEDALDNTINTDTIIIAAGEYNPDSLKIQNNITIIGAGKENTKVNGIFRLHYALDTLPVTIESLYCLNVLQSDSTWSGTPLTIKNCSLQTYTNAINALTETADVIIQDCEIIGAVNVINPSCSASRKFINCTVGESTTLNIVASKDTIEFKNCIVNGKLAVLTIANSGLVKISNNNIADSLVFESVANSVLCKINGNTIGNAVRIQSSASTGVNLLNNTIKNNGIFCSSRTFGPAAFSNNKIENGGIKYTGRNANITISDNEINSNGHVSAIDFYSVTGGVISNNKIELPSIPNSGKSWTEDSLAICGIKVNSISFKGVFNNIIKGGEYGIYLKSLVSLPNNNNIIEEAGNGIYFATTACKIDSNKIFNCSADGMIIDTYEPGTNNSAQIRGNVVTSNLGNGIRILHNAKLVNNTLFENQLYDLYVETPDSLIPQLYARHNLWDHNEPSEIDLYDIYDNDEKTGIAEVVFDSIIFHPGIPELLLPLNDEYFPDSTKLTFLWKQDVNADAYEFTLSTDSLFSDTISNEIISDTTFSFSNLEYGNSYYWKVRSKRLGYVSEWSETRSFSTTIPTGISAVQSSAGIIKFYPNPVSDFLFIEIKSEAAPFNLKIFDIHGRIARSQKFYSGVRIDVSKLQAGVYFIGLQKGENTYSAQFVKK